MKDFSKKFENKYLEMVQNGELITRLRTEGEYHPSINDHFEQLYAEENDISKKYSKARSSFSKHYFINRQGILLYFDEKKNNIRLVGNNDKSSSRISYQLRVHKKTRTFRAYQLTALVFESESTEYANKLLKEQGIIAMSSKFGVKVHHKNEDDSNDPCGLLITVKKQHEVIHGGNPKSDIKNLELLLKTSNIFEDEPKDTLIIQSVKGKSLGSDVKLADVDGLHDYVRNQMFTNMKITQPKLIEYNGRIESVYTDLKGAMYILNKKVGIMEKIFNPDVAKKVFEES